MLIQSRFKANRAYTLPGIDPQLSISLSATVGVVGNPVTVTGLIADPASGDTTGTFAANVAGTWSGTTITLSSNALSANRTFTPSVTGTVTFTLTGNNGALPAETKTYTVNAAPSAGTLAYDRQIDTQAGMFGKHTQWTYCPTDGMVYCYGGDGSFNLPLEPGYNAMGDVRQSLNAVLKYDLSTPGGTMTQVSPVFGYPEDGTAPFYHDGATFVYNSVDDHFYCIPGFNLYPYRAHYDPYNIMQTRYAYVHKMNRTTGHWTVGLYTGNNNSNWNPEHWGGCYNPSDNNVWLQCTSGAAAYGVLKIYACGTGPGQPGFYYIGLPQVPGLPAAPGIGYELSTEPWPQQYNPVTNEIICFDGYRGYVIGINLTTFVPRIIAQVPALYDSLHPEGQKEPIRAIETAMAISVVRQNVYISYTFPYLVVGGVGGIWTVSLSTGSVSQVNHPPGPQSRIEAVYDDTNDCLMTGGIYGDAESNPYGFFFHIYKHTS